MRQAADGGGRPLGSASLALILIGLLGVHCASKQRTETSAEVLLNERMAAVLLREGRAREAEDAYRGVLKSDSKNAELHDGLGVALLLQGRVRESLDSFDRAIKLAPDRVLYRIHRGRARTEIGRYSDAEEDFRAAEASALPQDRMDALLHRGRLRQRQGDYAGAEAEFTAALALERDCFDCMIGRGVARESRGDFAAAAEDYLEAVRINPKSADANLRLGLALVTLKKNVLGRRYLQRTVDLDPSGEIGAKARQLLEQSPSS